jgi:hypothetical protein
MYGKRDTTEEHKQETETQDKALDKCNKPKDRSSEKASSNLTKTKPPESPSNTHNNRDSAQPLDEPE